MLIAMMSWGILNFKHNEKLTGATLQVNDFLKLPFLLTLEVSKKKTTRTLEGGDSLFYFRENSSN